MNNSAIARLSKVSKCLSDIFFFPSHAFKFNFAAYKKSVTKTSVKRYYVQFSSLIIYFRIFNFSYFSFIKLCVSAEKLEIVDEI